MATTDKEREFLYSQVRSIESDLFSASSTINDVESKLAYVEGAMGSLSSRLITVRGRGYAAMGYLEKSIDVLTKKWAESAPLLKQAFLNHVQPLNAQIRALEAETQRLGRNKRGKHRLCQRFCKSSINRRFFPKSQSNFRD
jgi:prefoldin subunit 5